MSIRKCRVCGCTDKHGCPEGCWWVASDLCSSCGDWGEFPDVALFANVDQARRRSDRRLYFIVTEDKDEVLLASTCLVGKADFERDYERIGSVAGRIKALTVLGKRQEGARRKEGKSK